eukprot:jgi/Psemu1/36518/gm1.36518_g
MATPKLQKPSCLDPDSAISKGVNQKKHNDTTVPGNTYTTYACQINTKNTPSSTMMRSGVYFNNREIFDTIHPAQVNHREGQVIKVLNLPVGMPLAKPPCISAIKHEALPPISTNITDRTLRRKHDAMQSEEEPRLRKKTRREERRSMDEKPKEKRSQRTRAGNSACNPSSGNTLSSEERLFFEAAKKLSSSDVPALKIEESLKEYDSNTAAGDLTFPEPLTTMSKFMEFDTHFREYLWHKRGFRKTSLLYMIRKESAVTDSNERNGTVGSGPSDAYADWTEYSIRCMIQSGSHWTKDNTALWGILFKLAGAGPGWSYVQGLGSTGGGVWGDGGMTYFSLYSQAYESTNVRRLVEEKRAFLQSSTYNGNIKHCSFDKHKRKWYDTKEFLLRHNSFPHEDQFVTNFCHSISDPRLDIAGNKHNNNGNSSPGNNNGNKKHKASNTPTYTGSLEGKFYPREVWITMSAAQKAQIKSLLPAGKISGNANVSSITFQGDDSDKWLAGNQFGSHTHKKPKIGQPIVHIKSLGLPSSAQDRCNMDSHADATAAGSNMV